MDFAQAEIKFKGLKAQFEAGELTETEFKTQLEELMVQDEAGSWWMIGYETERWYRHDGESWVQADPLGTASKITNPVVPSASEETKGESSDKLDQEIADKAKREKIQKIQWLLKRFLQNNEIVIPKSNRTPILALFLSYFFGGGGQIYLGQVKKGIVLIIASVLIYLPTFFLTIPLIGAFCATDAYCIAKKMKKGHNVKDWEFGFNWKVFLRVLLYVVGPIAVIGIIFLILDYFDIYYL